MKCLDPRPGVNQQPPVQDEPVEAVLRIYKNPILPARMDFFFFTSSLPQKFPPSYLPPTNPSPPRSIARVPEMSSGSKLGAGAGVVGARAWSLELGAGAWSCRSLELGAVGARELWLEPERDPGKHLYFFSHLFVLFVLFVLPCYVLVELRCNVA